MYIYFEVLIGLVDRKGKQGRLGIRREIWAKLMIRKELVLKTGRTAYMEPFEGTFQNEIIVYVTIIYLRNYIYL